MAPLMLLEGLTLAAAWQVLAAILPVWLLGALTGYLLPRPSSKSSSSSASWALVVNSSNLRWCAALWHLGLVVRDVWKQYTAPGTFRAFCRAVIGWARGKGFVFHVPTIQAEAIPDLGSTQSTRDADNWYVTQKDLAFFRYHMEQNGEASGASAWELMMDKDLPGVVRYQAWRRTLANGKTEYKSVTISPDATAQEFSDMYFDDDFRPKWDTMIIHHEVLEHGDFAQRQQVVRWIRRFPFKFLSDREYSIARRRFKVGDTLYGLTKAIDHPRTRSETRVVKMDVFYSMWRSRTVECPWGSGKPACETVLLHHEQFKIPENLARFAVRHGMWGFLKTLSERTPEFVAARRQRVAPAELDPQAYGHGCCPNPPMRRAEASQSSLSLSSIGEGSGGGGSVAGTGADNFSHQSSSLGHLRTPGGGGRSLGLLAGGLAVGLAVLLNRSSSVPNLANPKMTINKQRSIRMRKSNSMML